MAFKGIDFAKLSRDLEAKRAMSPSDRADLEAREEFARSARHVVADDDMRIANSSELRVVVLAADPDVRFADSRRDVTGERRTGPVMLLSSRDDGRPFDAHDDSDLRRAVYYPSEAERLRDEPSGGVGLDAHMGGLGVGSKVTLLGRDVSRNWKDGEGRWRSVKEFHAMRMGPGELTREQLERMDPNGLVSASRAHETASSRVEREAVARRHLGQPAPTGGKGPEVPDGPVATSAREGRGR